MTDKPDEPIKCCVHPLSMHDVCGCTANFFNAKACPCKRPHGPVKTAEEWDRDA